MEQRKELNCFRIQETAKVIQKAMQCKKAYGHKYAGDDDMK